MTSPSQFYNVQEIIYKNVSVIRIHTSRVQEVKPDKIKLGDNNYILVLDSNDNFCNDFGAMFVKLVNKYKDLVHHYVSPHKLFEHVEGREIGIPSLDIKTKKTVWRLELQILKKDDICTKNRWYLGHGHLVMEQLMQKVMKSKDHD